MNPGGGLTSSPRPALCTKAGLAQGPGVSLCGPFPTRLSPRSQDKGVSGAEAVASKSSSKHAVEGDPVSSPLWQGAEGGS